MKINGINTFERKNLFMIFKKCIAPNDSIILLLFYINVNGVAI